MSAAFLFFIDYIIANWYLWVLISIAGFCAVAAEIYSPRVPSKPMGTVPATIISLAIYGGCALAALSGFLAAGKYVWRHVVY